MVKQMHTTLVAAALAVAVTASPIFAQTPNDKMSDHKMSSKMSHKDKMEMMDKLSADEKAAMVENMSEKDRMAAMKMAGHDMGKMSSQERMTMKDKMTAQEKADMFDKMPMESGCP